MAGDKIMHVQPEVLAIDETNNYLNNQLWKLCAGPLFDTPKIGEKLVASMNDELCQLKPIFDIPSKICCNVFSINLKVEINTDEIYAEVSLVPDTSDVEIPIPKNKNNIQNINYFTKVLSDSDTRKNGGFVLYKRHAIECLPLLDMSQLTPSQEIIAKDIHGREWSFKHTLRGTPKRHLFSSGWNEFAKGKELVAGDSFVFLRGENGESRVGISKAPHQQHNIPTSLISKQSMHHGVVATVLNAIREKCMFVVFYKPRSSQFLVNFDKFVDTVNNKFSIGSKFSMRFEGKYLNEIRYNGTVVGVRDFSTHWKDSEWRSLEVQWDGAATIPRPDKVSPWEIELLTHSSPIFKSDDLKHKRQIEVNEFGNYSFPTMSKPNYNEQMVQAMKETTTTATTSCRLFGVDLTVPATTNDSIKPIDSYKKIKISKIFEEEEIVNHVQARSLTKVHMKGVIEKTVDLTIFDGYNQLIDEMERLFDIKGELHMHNQWKMFFIYDEGDMMILGDDPWPKFCNMAKEIFICSKEDVKIGIADNRFSKGDPTLTTTILPPDVNSN
ncbi:auxin response factor 13-like [Raphanus sativus]|uniref:Auxin response factor n=1 Tax=Raphanus sativus TaxID=3726 RepID=A0A9W3C910_RAPSA|nr:auxin response factor 13-like [Raphanus sativus]